MYVERKQCVQPHFLNCALGRGGIALSRIDARLEERLQALYVYKYMSVCESAQRYNAVHTSRTRTRTSSASSPAASTRSITHAPTSATLPWQRAPPPLHRDPLHRRRMCRCLGKYGYRSISFCFMKFFLVLLTALCLCKRKILRLNERLLQACSSRSSRSRARERVETREQKNCDHMDERE